MNRFFFRDRITSQYTAIVLSILIVPFLISLFLLVFSVRLADDYSKISMQVQLKRSAERTEEALSEMSASATKIAQNTELLLLNSYDETLPDNVEHLYKLTNKFSSEISVPDYCKGFYIYVDAIDVVLHDKVIYKTKEFYDIHINGEDYLLWKEELTKNYFRTCYLNTGNLTKLSENGVFEYRFSYPIGGQTKGTIAFIVDNSIFVENELFSNESNKIMDKYVFFEDKLVYPVTTSQKSDFLEYLQCEDGFIEKPLNGSKFVFKASSEVDNLKFIYTDNENTSYNTVKNISIFIVLYALLVLLIGGFYVLKMWKKMSKRNMKIYRLLTDGKSETKVLDWNLITEGLNELSLQRKSIENLSGINKKLEQEQLIREFLLCKSDHIFDLQKKMQNAGMPFNEPDFLVVFGTYSYAEELTSAVLKETIERIIEDKLADGVAWYLIDCNWNQIFILFYGSICNEIKEEINETLKQLRGFFEKYISSELIYSTGDVCHSLVDVHKSAHKLMVDYEYESLYELEKSVPAGESRAVNYNYQQKDENKLTNLVLLGNIEEVQEFLKKIFNEHKDSSQIVQRTLFFNLLATLFKCAEQLNALEMVNGIEDALDLRKCTEEDFYDSINVLFTELCIRAFSQAETSNLGIIGEKILKYIEANFSDSDLSLKKISAEFGITTVHVSRAFKEYSGCNFSQFLTIKRIDKAKELLIESNLNVTEISKTVGYVDSSVFIKNFKKLTNFTPKQYREMNN